METSDLTLRAVTRENVLELVRLKVAPDQAHLVATNGDTIAEGAYTPHVWMRGIYEGDEPVGFVAVNLYEEQQLYYLWRFMVAAGHQRRGIGRRAMAQVIAHVRTRPGARALLTSVVPGTHDPTPFYEKLGFVETGEVSDGENVLELDLRTAGESGA